MEVDESRTVFGRHAAIGLDARSKQIFVHHSYAAQVFDIDGVQVDHDWDLRVAEEGKGFAQDARDYVIGPKSPQAFSLLVDRSLAGKPGAALDPDELPAVLVEGLHSSETEFGADGFFANEPFFQRIARLLDTRLFLYGPGPQRAQARGHEELVFEKVIGREIEVVNRKERQVGQVEDGELTRELMVGIAAQPIGIRMRECDLPHDQVGLRCDDVGGEEMVRDASQRRGGEAVDLRRGSLRLPASKSLIEAKGQAIDPSGRVGGRIPHEGDAQRIAVLSWACEQRNPLFDYRESVELRATGLEGRAPSRQPHDPYHSSEANAETDDYRCKPEDWVAGRTHCGAV